MAFFLGQPTKADRKKNTEVWKADDDRNLVAPPANCQDCRLADGRRWMKVAFGFVVRLWCLMIGGVKKYETRY